MSFGIIIGAIALLAAVVLAYFRLRSTGPTTDTARYVTLCYQDEQGDVDFKRGWAKSNYYDGHSETVEIRWYDNETGGISKRFEVPHRRVYWMKSDDWQKIERGNGVPY